MEQAQRAEQPTADRDRIPLIARSVMRNGRESLTGAAQPGGKSLAVEQPYVEFVGALCAQEDGTKPSERSFSEEKRA